MNKWWCTFLFSFSLHAEVITLHTWEEIEQKLETLTPEDLAVFDVDDTLIVYTHPLMFHESYPIIGRFIKENKLSNEIVELATSKLFARFDWVELRDSKIPATLNQLKERSIKCIALTAQSTGKRGDIPRMEEWRHLQLRDKGIDFSKGPFRSTLHFSQLDAVKVPVFHDGILCSWDVPKGIVLAAFLDRINFKPQRIVFIDDKKDWVEGVAKEMDDRSIPNLCIHYHLAERQIRLDPDEIVRQLETFLSELSLQP